MTSPKTALIIGGSRGIGRAIALRLARDGYAIVTTCRQESEATRSLADEIAALGAPFQLLCFNVGDRIAARRHLEAAFGESGAPDVAVFNAGIAEDNLFVFMTPEQWSNVMSTNLNGFYHAIQPLVFGMLARKSGRIIAVSSASGQTGQAGQVNYSAAKAGLIGAVKALAREVGRKGVLVNAVAPGLIETDMTKDLPLDRILPMIPLARAGIADEVAGVVSFLCGPDSTYIHGQVIAVNGGLVM